MNNIHYKDYKIEGNILCILYNEPYLEYIGIFLLIIGILIINNKSNYHIIKLTRTSYIDNKINNHIDNHIDNQFDYKIINKFNNNNNIPKFNNNNNIKFNNNNNIKFNNNNINNNIYKFINNNYNYDNITLFLDIITFINNIVATQQIDPKCHINNKYLMDYYNHYNNIIAYILSLDESSNDIIPKLLDDLVDDYNANSKQLYILSKKIFDTYDFKDIKHNMIMKYLSNILLNILDKEIGKIDA
jgi:hypothetical protein